MSSFSDKLKAASTATYNTRIAKLAATPVTLAAEPAVMTLEEPLYNGLAYDPETASEEVTEDWILSDKYLYYAEYHDDNISTIDDQKNISVNDKQINITQETNSQFIPFQMPRYYDGYDLMNAIILIHFVNQDGFEDKVNVVNVYYNNDKIRFGWLVGKNATAVAGNLKFEIEAIGVNSKGEEYNWKTKSNSSLSVLQSLCGNGIIEPDESWITSFLTQVTEHVGTAQAASNEAKIAAQEAKEVAANVEDTIANAESTIEGNVLTTIRGEVATTLDGYYDKEETNTLVSDKETSILNTLRTEITNALLNYYTIEQVNKMFEDFDISDQLVGIEKDITDLSTKHDNEVKDLNTRIDNIDGLAKFNVEYAEESRTLTFYNGEDEIKAIVLNSNPTTEWVTAYDTKVDTKISEALSPINEDLQGIHENIDNLPETLKTDYYTKDETFNREEIEELIDNVDVTEELGNLVDGEGNKLTVEQYVKQEVEVIDVSDQVYTKVQSDEKYASKSIESVANTNATNIQTINTAITAINQTLESIDKSPNAQYVTTYNEPYELNGVQYTGENTLAVHEIYYKDTERETRTVVSAHVITGGSGGSSSANVIKIDRITSSPLVVTEDDDVIIEYTFTATDSSGDDIGQCNASWKIGNKVVKTEKVYTGENSVNLTEFIGVGSDQKVTLTISDDIGTIQQKTWYVSVVDVKLESTFDDTRYYEANTSVTFTYTPKGAVDKTVHFLLDGEEIDTVVSAKAAAGLSASYTISAHGHGTHLLEVYMTAEINSNTIESNHIVKDIIWYDAESDAPVIGTVYQDFTARQYETTNIKYTVYDPSTETPSVTLRATYVNEDGETVETYNSSLVLSSNTDVWAFKTDVIGEHILTITCGETVKVLKATIEDIGIEVSPTTAGLEFDFNPVGYSNNDANRIWSDKNTGVAMTVSDNFDWVNGGYQMDEAGDQYFCIKAGTTATINYNLFADDAKVNGKEFKVIFKTTNVKSRNTSFISCMDYGIGLDMKVESANIYSSNGNLYSPYCEDDVIEFEFNINKNTDIPMVVTYEDGVGNRPMIYTSDSSFWQTNPTPISIGSQNCDVHIYRMKAYSTSLTDSDILNNFIADARSAEEMIARYTRNQIYKEGVLDPEYLAEVCPDLRIILVDAPWFTNDKDNKIDDTNITMIYKNGDPVLDNWTCTGARHSGQGTSSNEYGYSSRNIDLIMDTDTSLFTLGDGVTTANTITLTRNSVPTDYLNVKVNVASNENENNAQNARNYSLFNPFIRFARWKDSNVKDCMEFFNCVIFIRERDEDISTHREFQDTNYHFYSIGNVGDSKKTDDTRVNNKKDPKEHTIEIKDYNVPLAEFPTGTEGICSESEWKAGNTAYDNLYAEYKYKDGKFKSFGNDSYEFRYEMKGITEEQRQANIDVWRDMYKFIVTSSDEDFYAKLKEWFVVDSALYYYLFTERYLMVDNRAKNSFWHYGKVYISDTEAELLDEDAGGYIIDNEQAAIREGYRYDLTQGYDFDTSFGIDNTGKLVLTYGMEDKDFYVDGDSTSGYIYRAAESTFFCRLRDLFHSEMQAMFVDRENVNAWSASRVIKQWDDAQNQFPEELWRLDIQRKYLRTYQGISIDNSFPGEANPRFLTEMMNGRKKYQRRMFERNQELYMATKYFGKVATQDQIMMRFNNPVGATITPDFTLYITPYSDMYIGTSFGNVTPTNFRAKAGVEYTIPCSIESGTADITLIYGASFIQAIGDLSRCYVGDNDFSKASRLQSLVIGSDRDGYSNSFMTKIALGNNKLLEYLDIRKITGLNSVVDLSQCSNLLELHAEGSGATGVIFANGGKVKKAYIPAITSLTMKNLNYLEEFVIDNYEKLQTLIVEYTPFINTHEVVTLSPILKVLRLIGLDWNIETTAILNRILGLRGINNIGGEITQSVLSGNVYVPVIRQQELREFNNAWSDLEVDYDTLIEQFPVTFVNHDGTILDVQYIDKGSYAVDPTTREENPIATPIKESTISTDYTFNGWDTDISVLQIFTAKTITATYVETTRKYTIKYVSKNTILQTSTGLYGENIVYTGDIPTYTLEENGYKYYLFNRWDKSGFLDGDFDENGVKTVNAIFDEFEYTSNVFNGKQLKDLSPVQIYALTKLTEPIDKELSDFGMEIETGDDYSFKMGYDVDYDDIESVELISEKTVYDGKNCYDTGIKLFDSDKDFVVAVDYKMSHENSSGATLMQCYQTAGSNGFKLSYESSSPLFTWGGSKTQPVNPASTDCREMLVIRHIKGDNNLYIYTSNLEETSVKTYTFQKDVATQSDNATLVLGALKQDSGRFVNYAIGEINWCKIWYKDLGDSVCKDLVGWVHEDITLETSGFYRYQLYDDYTKESMMSLLGTHLLSVVAKYNTTNTNVGGWASSSLNNYLNTRFYQAIPYQIKSLMKKVSVSSTIGGKSSTISSSGCYVTVPAVYDVCDHINNDAYRSEVYDANGTISFMTGETYEDGTTDRKRAFNDGDYYDYWLRSPYLEYSNYVWRVDKDGNMQEITNPSNSRLGLLIEISF